MHDKLPIELFKIENFVKLLEAKNHAAACYWFPISLTLLAVDGEKLGFDYRKFFLECAFWFLVFYREAWNETEGRLKQRAYQGDNDVVFYTSDLLVEFTNTIHCHLRLMESLPCFSFDRNSSMPLEHKFGLARMKAHDVHTLKRFLRTISTLQADQHNLSLARSNEIDQECEKIKIRKRRAIFGTFVEPKGESQEKYCVFYNDNEHRYSPQIVAKSMLIVAGFEIPNNVDIINVDDVMSWTYLLLSEFCDNKTVKRKAKNEFSLIQRRLGVGQCSNGKRLITKSQPEDKQLTSKVNKYNFAHDLVCEIYGGEPTKDELYKLIEEIKAYDSTAKAPKRSAKKYQLQKWISENISIYYMFLQRFIE